MVGLTFQIRSLTNGLDGVRIHRRKATAMIPHSPNALDGNQERSLEPAPPPGTHGNAPANGMPETHAEEWNYRPVPPRSVVRTSVCCRVRGRGQPLPYLIDEETDE
jgi:hypothetical protein